MVVSSVHAGKVNRERERKSRRQDLVSNARGIDQHKQAVHIPPPRRILSSPLANLKMPRSRSVVLGRSLERYYYARGRKKLIKKPSRPPTQSDSGHEGACGDLLSYSNQREGDETKQGCSTSATQQSAQEQTARQSN